MKKLIVFLLSLIVFNIAAAQTTVPKVSTGHLHTCVAGSTAPRGGAFSCSDLGFSSFEASTQYQTDAQTAWLAKISGVGQAICNAYAQRDNANYSYTYQGGSYSAYQGSWYGYVPCKLDGYTAVDQIGFVFQYSPPATTCPANSTDNGSSCTCAAGYVAQDGQCVVNNPCSNLAGQSMIAFGTYTWVRGATSSCSGGCAQTVQGDSLHDFYWQDSNGQWVGHYTSSQFVYTGEQCTGGGDPATTAPTKTDGDEVSPLCKAGEFAGEVNGVSVCVPASTTSTTNTETKTNTDSTGATTGTETVTHETVCNANSCNTTETVTRSDGTSTTITNTISKGEHCSNNPGAPECKSSFEGTCKNDFKCKSSDAVQCAIALDQYRTNCELLSRPDKLGEDLENLIGDELRGLDINTFTIERPNAPSGSSCSITPFSIQVGMGSFVVDFTHLCAYLGIIRAIVTAFGFVMWTLIVFVRQ